ncbi:MAG: hypothetical protein K2K98_12715 [Muribaculaceae bacterium]|nr:hypothetical protein [Muribaculaceae bacterium]
MKVELSRLIIPTFIIFYLISTILLKPFYERDDPKNFPFKQNRKKAIFNLIWVNLVFSGIAYFFLFEILSLYLPKVIIVDNNESVNEYLLLSDDSNDNMKASFNHFYIKNESLQPIYAIKVDFSKKTNQEGRIEFIRQIKSNESFCLSKEPYSEMKEVPDYIHHRKTGKIFKGSHTFIVSESEYYRLMKKIYPYYK